MNKTIHYIKTINGRTEIGASPTSIIPLGNTIHCRGNELLTSFGVWLSSYNKSGFVFSLFHCPSRVKICNNASLGNWLSLVIIYQTVKMIRGLHLWRTLLNIAHFAHCLDYSSSSSSHVWICIVSLCLSSQVVKGPRMEAFPFLSVSQPGQASGSLAGKL